MLKNFVNQLKFKLKVFQKNSLIVQLYIKIFILIVVLSLLLILSLSLENIGQFCIYKKNMYLFLSGTLIFY